LTTHANRFLMSIIISKVKNKFLVFVKQISHFMSLYFIFIFVFSMHKGNPKSFRSDIIWLGELENRSSLNNANKVTHGLFSLKFTLGECPSDNTVTY